MRPKKLIMSAFCPYPDKVEIDFEKFADAGLFLVTGDTGAGKTTIFDAISFALYGEVSGENRGVDMLRSDFAQVDTPTYVQFVFEHRGQIYEIKRSPQYLRPAKRGNKDKLVKSEATVELLFGENQVLTGKDAVLEKIQELLGIDHRQFKQIAMIAQGEFLKLLLAESRVREEIFRKIFNTHLYEQLQQALKTQSLNLKTELNSINSSIEQYKQDIICPAANPHYIVLQELLVPKSNIGDLLKVLREIIGFDKQGEQAQRDYQIKLQEKLEENLKLLTSAKRINEQLEKRQVVHQKIAALESQAVSYQNLEKKLEKYKLANFKVKPLEIKMGNLEQQGKILKATLIENQNKILANEPLQLIKQAEVANLTAQQNLRDSLAVKIENINQSLPVYQELDALRKQEKLLKGQELELLEKKNNQENSLSIKENSLQKLETQLRLEADIEIRLLNTEAEYREVSKLLLEIKQVQQELKEQECITQNLEKQQALFTKEYQNYQVQEQKYNQQEAVFYAAQAGILAAKLQPQQPCPVCGSFTHPQLATLTSVAPTQEQLEKIKFEKEQQRTLAETIKAVCLSLKEELKQKHKHITARLENIGNLVVPDTFSQNLEELEQNQSHKLEILKQEIEQLKAKCKKKSEYQVQQTKLLEAITADKEFLKQLEPQVLAVNLAITKLASSIQEKQKMLPYQELTLAKQALQESETLLAKMKTEFAQAQLAEQQVSKLLAEAQAILAETEKSIAGVREQYLQAKEQYLQELKAVGFENSREYQENLCSLEEIAKQEDILNQYKLALNSLKVQDIELEVQISGQSFCDLQAGEIERQMLLLELEKAQQQLEKWQYNRQNNEDVLQKLQRQQNQQSKIEAKYLDYKILADTANGELSGKQKIAFERYVQGVYFEMVLSEANKRLAKMTNRRYKLVRRYEANNLRERTGLEIDVADDNTGKIRGVKSLSGGESFQASLALALGLADVVQRFSGGVKLDTMFIDEGFGSLDSESLEKALQTLGALATGNRLVGIISHVEELKNKIDKKIIITRETGISKISLEF